MSAGAVADGIYTLLTTAQGVGTLYAAVGGRIYHGVGPQDAALPLLTMQLSSDVPWRFFASSDINMEVQIDLWGKADDGASAILATNAKLITLCDTASVTISGYAGGQMYALDRGAPVVEGDAIRVMSRWTIWANVSP